MATVGLTGEDGHVVLVGLAQGVVDDAVLIRETLEDVHTDLRTDVQQSTVGWTSLTLTDCFPLGLRPPLPVCHPAPPPTLAMKRLHPQAALSMASSCCSSLEVLLRLLLPSSSASTSRRSEALSSWGCCSTWDQS